MPLSVNPHCRTLTLNESPSEKEGKFSVRGCVWLRVRPTLNESPSEKEGKLYYLMGDCPKTDVPQ